MNRYNLYIFKDFKFQKIWTKMHKIKMTNNSKIWSKK